MLGTRDGRMAQLDRAEFLLEFCDFSAHRLDLLCRYVLYAFAQIERLDITQLACKTFVGRRCSAMGFRGLGRLEGRGRRACDGGQNAEYHGRYAEAGNHKQGTERGEHRST